ncbi:MAG: proline--tRNA ligase [Candidatus Methanomethylicus sp.]|nr:proline--tRNA ligase [Candidatus Methanomethylicus sp.]
MAKTPERKVWAENYSDWFHKILSEVPVYDTRYPVKGTGIWTPFGFKLRKGVIEIIRDELEKANHEEVLFPLLIPDYMLGKEGDHIKKFDDEVYWVTHGGRDLLDVKLALRPTSETAIYPMFQLWVNAYSDLPIRIFQIVNIFRYETKATRPMIRVREVSTFKEAHTAHATREDAENQVQDGIAIYSRIFERLRIPFFKSIRPEWDKFPGAEYSVAFDTILPDGKVLQIGTVHFLGQGFAKAFDIKYMTANGGYEYVWQTCYGISERAIAALISTHGDDNGMNLPSNVAPVQAVIIPIVYKGKEEDVLKKCNEVKGILTSAGIRTAVDDRKEITPGNKYFAWELKGTPVRIELGPRDIEAATAVLVRRDLLQKTVVPISAIAEGTKKLLASVDEALGERSKKWMAERLTKVTSLDDLQKTLDSKGGIVEVPWCGGRGCGEEMEAKMNARILGTPYHDEMVVECSQSCVFCGKDATKAIRIARSY